MMLFNPVTKWTITQNQVKYLNILLIVIIAAVPLLMQYPFNINIFLTWEGAYRIFLGQVPSIDFYLPMGFVFWILPALFFKIFGPNLFTLIIFQSFINLITFLSFWHVLRLLKVNYYVIFLSSLVLGLSYVLLNFWPWYNNFVFVLQLVSLMFLLMARASSQPIKKTAYLIIAAGFSVFAFFTKQDAGALTILLNVALVLYLSVQQKNVRLVAVFVAGLIIWTIPFTIPFLDSDISYWFNYGQQPHYSRLNAFTFLNEIFRGSHDLKVYLLIIVLFVIHKYNSIRELIKSEVDFLFLILILGIIFQASIIQVTSYIPHYSHYYVHGFAFAFILSQFNFAKMMNRFSVFSVITLLVIFVWSSDTWKYGIRIGKKILPSAVFRAPENVVSKNTWLSETATVYDNRSNWRLSDFKTFKNIYLPQGTIRGINKLLVEFKGRKDLQVLNMSELTMLAEEIGYTPLIDHPLWYHKNVSIFEKEILTICNNIRQEKYDLVLFESIPILNNFYPEEIHTCLKENYLFINEFRAPRREQESSILVYKKKN